MEVIFCFAVDFDAMSQFILNKALNGTKFRGE